MKEADASNFFRRRSRRGVKSQDEINGEFTLGLSEFRLRSGQPWCFVVIVGIYYTGHFGCRITLTLISSP